MNSQGRTLSALYDLDEDAASADRSRCTDHVESARNSASASLSNASAQQLSIRVVPAVDRGSKTCNNDATAHAASQAGKTSFNIDR